MGKGILLELDGGRAVVLTPEGEFKRIPLPKGAWDIGDEVSFSETRPVSWTKWGVWASAAAVMLLVGFQGFNAWALSQPVALLTVDINPSLQFTLNKRSEVLTAEALNADGAQVLQGVDWKGGIWKRHSADDVVAQVTAKAVEIGKLAPEDESGAVVVAVAPAVAEELPAAQSEAILAKTKVAANETIARKATEKKVEVKAKVAVVVVTKREKEEAEKAGLTPGKWTIYQELKDAAPEVQPEVIQEKLLEKGPGKVFDDLNLNPADIFGKAEEKHDGKHDDKDKEEKKGRKSEEQPAVPASGQPAADKQGAGEKQDPAGGKSDNGKKDDQGKVDENKGKAEENKGKAEENKSKAEENKSNAQGNKANGEKKTGQQVEKPSTQPSAPKSNSFVDTIKSWFGFGEKKDESSQKPRAETPGAGASDDSTAGSEPKGEEKKAEPKVEEKKSEPKAEEKKTEPKAEEKKSEPKAEEKQSEPKAEENKGSKERPAGEEKSSNQGGEKEKGRGSGKSQEKP